MRARGLLLGVACAAALAGCGAGLQSSSRGAAAAAPNEVFLVEVTDSVPARPTRLVTLSVIEAGKGEALAPRPAAGDVEAMRRYAAARGAHVLLLERLDTRWRRAHYGTGLRYLDDGAAAPEVPACDAATLAPATAAAQRQATRCFAGLKQARPALTGAVEVLFEVDAFGAVKQAAATPGSSRDGQVRGCALRAVFGQAWGVPRGLTCRARLSVSMQ